MRSQSDGNQHTKFISGMGGNMIAPDYQQRKQQQNSNCADKSQLFTNNGKYEVIFGFRQIQILLPGFTQSQAEQAAGTNGDQRLTGLPGIAQAVGKGIPPGHNPLSDIGIAVGHQKADEQRCTDACQANDQQLFQAGTAHKYQNQAHQHNQNRSGQVRLLDQKSGHQRHSHQKGQQSAPE